MDYATKILSELLKNEDFYKGLLDYVRHHTPDDFEGSIDAEDRKLELAIHYDDGFIELHWFHHSLNIFESIEKDLLKGMS